MLELGLYLLGIVLVASVSHVILYNKMLDDVPEFDFVPIALSVVLGIFWPVTLVGVVLFLAVYFIYKVVSLITKPFLKKKIT